MIFQPVALSHDLVLFLLDLTVQESLVENLISKRPAVKALILNYTIIHLIIYHMER